MSGSPLRFAMITTFYPPYSFGGDAVGVQRLSSALVRRGHQVTVIHDVGAYELLHRDPAPDPYEEQDGIRVHRLKGSPGFLSPLLTQQTGRPVTNRRKIHRVLRETDFDIVHFHNISLIGGPGILSAGDGLKVYEAHEHWLVCPTHVLWRHNREVCTGRECLRCVLHYRRPPQLWRYTGHLERQLRHIDLFIAKSEFSRQKHREFGFLHEMEVLPYFLPDTAGRRHQPGDASPAPPTTGTDCPDESSSPHERPYFLFTGRLERIKGLDDVIPVFERYRDADLLIAGSGTHESALRALAAGNPRVRFLGRRRPEELGRYYEHAIALLVPSICFETFGIVLIEAFRQGTPVIAREIGPFPELVQSCGGGELFSDARGLEAAMRRMQEDPAYRRRCSEAAHRGFHERWSDGAVVPRYMELIRKAALARGKLQLAATIAMQTAA